MYQIIYMVAVEAGAVLFVLFCGSVAQGCPTLGHPPAPGCSTPGFPVFHYLPKFTQTHVHWVDDAIQPSHPLSLPSPPSPSVLLARDNYNFLQTALSASANCSIYLHDRREAHPSFTLHFSQSLSIVNSLLTNYKYLSPQNMTERPKDVCFPPFSFKGSCHLTKLNFPFILCGWVCLISLQAHKSYASSCCLSGCSGQPCPFTNQVGSFGTYLGHRQHMQSFVSSLCLPSTS